MGPPHITPTPLSQPPSFPINRQDQSINPTPNTEKERNPTDPNHSTAQLPVPNLDAAPQPQFNTSGIITRSKNNVFKPNRKYVHSTSTGSKPSPPKTVQQALKDHL